MIRSLVSEFSIDKADSNTYWFINIWPQLDPAPTIVSHDSIEFFKNIDPFEEFGPGPILGLISPISN